jgi:citrate lyase subunit beta/citryl-CoA lyase
MNASLLSTVRSALFVPLADERFLARAHERGADALLLDLEDSVPPAQKAEARARLAGAVRRLTDAGATAMVRVNNDAALLAEDLRAAVQARAAAVFLPKAESADQVKAASFLLDGCDAGVVAMIESPAAVLDAPAIARAGGRLAGLAFGSEDYCGALGIASDKAALDWPAQMIAVAARAHGLAAFGLPGPVAEIADMDGYARLLEKSRAMGYTGCLCIHPKQVVAANRAHAPGEAELALAREIVEAFEAAVKEGRGAFALHGRMIDAPVAEQARATLARALRAR